MLTGWQLVQNHCLLLDEMKPLYFPRHAASMFIHCQLSPLVTNIAKISFVNSVLEWHESVTGLVWINCMI